MLLLLSQKHVDRFLRHKDTVLTSPMMEKCLFFQHNTTLHLLSQIDTEQKITHFHGKVKVEKRGREENYFVGPLGDGGILSVIQ